MASDGAIIIDTGIDNKGFKRGAREFTNAVNGLKNAVDQTGKAVAESTNSYIQAMNRAKSAAKGLTGDQRSITREITKTEAALGKLNAKQEKMKTLAEQRAQEQRDQLREQMIEETKAAIGHGNWEIMPKWSQDQAIEQTMRDFEGRLAAIQSEPVENTDSWRSLQYDIDLATAKLEGLRSNLAELSGEAQAVVAPAIEEAVTEPVQVANEELQRYARLMGDWSATMQEDSWNEAPINDESAMLSISRYINTLIEQRNEAYHDTIARIEEAAAAANEENTAAQQTTEAVRNTASANTEAAQAAQETSRAEENVAQSAQRAESAFQRGAQEAVNQWNQMPSVMRSVGQYLTTISTAATHPAQALDRMAHTGIQGFTKLAGAAARAAANVAKMAGGGALSFLRKLAAGAKNAAIQLAKLAGSAIKGGMKKLGGMIGGAAKSLFGFNRAQSMADGGLKRGFMTILKYGLGIRGLFALFRRLRSAVAEGLGEIEKRNPKAKAAMDSLRGALNALKASLGSAFAPVVTAVAPALTKLINMLTSAINTIGAFIAALTGQSSYQKAVSGLNATGSAASGAAGEVEKLNRQLAGFDELNVLNSQDSGAGGGGGGGGGGSGLSYSTEEISGGITDFVNKLKEMWANADYEGIGREIAGAINNAFKKAKELISWENLEEPVTNAVNAITGIINGLVDGIDWEQIGETFGEGINTIVNTLNLLLDGIDWENIGKGFATGLNGLVDTVNWDNLGKAFKKKINAILDLIKGLVKEFDWGKAGEAFAATLNALFDKDLWDNLSETFSSTLSGILLSLRTLVKEFKWAKAAEAFATVLNSLFDKELWDSLSETFSSTLSGILLALRTLVKEFKWAKAAEAFATTLNSLFDKDLWDSLSETFSSTLSGILLSLRTLIKEFKWAKAAESFATVLNALFDKDLWDGLSETFSSALSGILLSLRTLVKEFKWAKAAESFATVLNSLFDKELWDSLSETFSSTMSGILISLRTLVKEFSWGNAGTALGKTLDAIFDKELWDGLAEAFGGAIDGIFGADGIIRKALEEFSITDSAGNVAGAINDFFADEERWKEAGTTVSEAIKGLFTWGTDFLNNLDTAQISADIKAALGAIDWPGIGKAIFDFLVAAIKAAGNLIWELLTDFPDEGQVEKEIKDWKEGVVGDSDVDLVFGLNPIFPDENEAIRQINEAISNGLETGNFQFPVGLDVEPETVIAASMEFVQLWNNAHPEAPVYYNIETGKVEPLAKEIMEDEDKTVTTKEDLKTGKQDASALKTRDDKDSTVTHKEDLKIGKEDKSAIKTRDAQNKTVTTTEGLAKGKENASALKTRDDKSESVTVTENLAKGKENASALKTRDDKNTTVTTTENLAKGKENASAIKTRDAKDKTKTTTENLAKGKENASAVKSRDAHDQKVTTTVKVAKGSVDKKAYKAITAKNNTVTTSVKLTFANVASGIKNAIKTLLGLETGGVLANGIWRSIPQYAAGTLRAGSIFAAGERGPELVGHIGGRTEVLNKSQLASTMFSAVENGMLSAISRLNFRMPAMATGSVLPYDVSAQIAKTGDDIMGTLNANNEDLIQTIISVAGQLVAAVQNTNRNSVQSGGLTVDEMIRQINQRTQMLGRSPLLG